MTLKRLKPQRDITVYSEPSKSNPVNFGKTYLDFLLHIPSR